MPRQRRQPASLDEMAAIRMAAKQASRLSSAHSPDDWLANVLPQTTLWSKQKEILNSLVNNRKTGVRSCHDSGKSFTASIATSFWLDTHPLGQARVITTAPTYDQVKGILWVEINQLRAQAPPHTLPGKTNQTEWWIGSYLAAMGRKPSDYNPAAFQGMHARFMLIIIDEASGVTPALFNAAETLATNEHARILAIGNPDDPQSMFAEINANPEKFGYHIIKIAAWDTPNFTGEAQQLPPLVRESLLHPLWVEERKQAWGEDNPFYISKVEAEFPEIDQQSIIKHHDLIMARIPRSERDLSHTPHKLTQRDEQIINATAQQPTLGVDVAGSESGDETIARLILPPNLPTAEFRFRSSDPEKVADFIYTTILATNPKQVAIDAIGVGFGIIGLVRALLRARIEEQPELPEIKVNALNSAQSANSPKIYGNTRAELWWETRLMFQNGLIDTSQAEDRDNLEAQLVIPRYYIRKGRIWVEDKNEIRQRIGRSPDNADAFLYALSTVIRNTLSTMTTVPQPQTTLMQRHQVPQLASAHSLSQRMVKPRV
jgi:hypothetical protein